MVATLGKELLAVPIACGLRFDFDVAVDAALASQTQLVLVAQVGEKSFGISGGFRRESLDQAAFAEILLALLDDDAAGTAPAQTVAIQRLMNAFVELDAGLASFRAEVRSGLNFDGLLLFGERDLRHCGKPEIRGTRDSMANAAG